MNGSPLNNGGRRADTLIETELQIARQRIPLSVLVRGHRSRLSDLVPLAQAMCDKLTAAHIGDLRRQNTPPVCRKGCSACCSYLVALSLPEVDYLRDVFASMSPAYYRSVLALCLEPAKKILNTFPKNANADQPADLELLSRWYAGLNQPCPFLAEGACTIYPHRPLACREYLVINNSAACRPNHPAEPDVARASVSVVEALGQLAGEYEPTHAGGVMLPLAFFSTEDDAQRAEHTWDAVEMVERFLAIIKESAAQSCCAAAV